jgi:hypothetical protein
MRNFKCAIGFVLSLSCPLPAASCLLKVNLLAIRCVVVYDLLDC